jgi:hypothetical protein
VGIRGDTSATAEHQKLEVIIIETNTDNEYDQSLLVVCSAKHPIHRKSPGLHLQ